MTVCLFLLSGQFGRTWEPFLMFGHFSPPFVFFQRCRSRNVLLGEPVKNPELEHEASYDIFHFPYFWETWFCGLISTNPRLSEFLRPMAGFARKSEYGRCQFQAEWQELFRFHVHLRFRTCLFGPFHGWTDLSHWHRVPLVPLAL